MNLKKLLFQYNPWWEKELNFINAYKRDSILNQFKNEMDKNNIVLITGLRRIGKTTLMKLFIKHLIQETKISPELIFYVSLDDYLLDKYSIIEIIEMYRKIHGLERNKKIFVFLDEISYKEKYTIQLKNLYDKENIKIFASSSSASVLNDTSALLTGREKIIKISPFFYNEYLGLKGIKIKESDGYLNEHYFEKYLLTGGFPEYILTNDISYINSLVDDILKKDIVLKRGLRDFELIKDFFLLLVNHSCGILSIYKIANTLKISTETAQRYFNYFLEVFLINRLRRCGKLNKRINSPSKIYMEDIGIRQVFSEGTRIGKQFENYAYLMIKSHNLCYIYENSIEIDFLIDKNYLVEIKYNDELKKNQKELFKKTNANKKMIIKNLEDLIKLKKALRDI
jgi:predicted AAA+ superfamily ATPase